MTSNGSEWLIVLDSLRGVRIAASGELINPGGTQLVVRETITARLVDPRGDNWQWQDGETGDGVSYSYSYRKQRWLRVEDTDSAFVLSGQSPPRP